MQPLNKIYVDQMILIAWMQIYQQPTIRSWWVSRKSMSRNLTWCTNKLWTLTYRWTLPGKRRLKIRMNNSQTRLRARKSPTQPTQTNRTPMQKITPRRKLQQERHRRTRTRTRTRPRMQPPNLCNVGQMALHLNQQPTTRWRLVSRRKMSHNRMC